MSCCCSSPCGAIEEQFDARVAQRELAQYRKKGPGQTTRLLRDGVTAVGGPIETLLDVGAGIGALTFELLERGVRRAVSVDASTACVAAGREEAGRRSRVEQVEWVQGDYVALAQKLPPADVVTLDRVVCCYPRFEPLLGAAARHAQRCVAISYPRDVWFVRLALAGQNALRALKGRKFRVVVHPPREMEQLIRSHGFALSARRTTGAWCVDVYVKKPLEDQKHGRAP
jgi:magnesium-protoporphyrin O-methyltransferase